MAAAAIRSTEAKAGLMMPPVMVWKAVKSLLERLVEWVRDLDDETTIAVLYGGFVVASTAVSILLSLLGAKYENGSVSDHSSSGGDSRPYKEIYIRYRAV